MYTTNAIESVNHSFRKVTNKGAFPHKEAVYKLLYLRVKELEDKWDDRPVKNWPLVLNQLLTDKRFEARIKSSYSFLFIFLKKYT